MSTQINNAPIEKMSLKELTNHFNKEFSKKKKLGSISKAQLIFRLLPKLNPNGIAIIVENIGSKSGERPKETTFTFSERKEAKRWLKDRLSEDEVETFVRDGWSYTCTAIEQQQQFTSTMSYRQIIKGEVMKLADKKKADQKKAKEKITKKLKKGDKKTEKKDKIHPTNLVTLKELVDDPRAARITLRAGIKKGTIKHTASNRWEWKKGSKELTAIKKFLKIK